MKPIQGKRKKTDADHEELSRIEWLAGLYRTHDDIVIPAHVLEGAFVAGAKKTKRGIQAKSGAFFSTHASLLFPGKPQVIDDDSLAELFKSDEHTFTTGVCVNAKRIMRTRPIFRSWSLVASLQYDPDVFNAREIQQIWLDTGRLVGIGDWRPKYGRFTATPVIDTPVIPDSVPQMLLAV